MKVPVKEEILLIGREALANSFIHANAKAISVDINFQHRKLHLSVSDDGCGIPSDIISAGGRENHWGLIGMRERAGKMNGTLKVSSKSNKGTWIELSVPGRVAYQNPSKLAKMLQLDWMKRSPRDLKSTHKWKH